MPITYRQLLKLKKGDYLHQTGCFNADGSCIRWVVVEPVVVGHDPRYFELKMVHGTHKLKGRLSNLSHLQLVHMPMDSTCKRVAAAHAAERRADRVFARAKLRSWWTLNKDRQKLEKLLGGSLDDLQPEK